MATFDNLVQQREADIASQEGRATERQAALDQATAATGAAREKELAPMEAKASEQLAGLENLQAPKPSRLPEYKPGPIVDAKDYQGFSMALLGMALMGGAASKGNWLGVSASLNGALKGYLEGSQEKAKEAYEQYQRQFEAAKARDAQAQKEFEDILRSKTLTINAQLQQVKLAAAKYDRQDIRQAAEQKSIDAIWRQVEGSRSALAGLEERHDRVQLQIDAAMERLKFSQGGGSAQLTDAGRAWVEKALMLGDKGPMQMIASRFGAPRTVPIINDLAEKNVDPGDVIAGKVDLAAYTSAARVTAVRQAGVERLTGSVQHMERRVLELAQQVVPTGMPAANAALNWLKQHMGDQQLAKLRTEILAVSRQYMEATTMPGSNAQLHAGAQDMADSLLNSNMTVGQLVGAFEGINEDIAAGSEALTDTSKRLHDLIAKHGMTLAPAEQRGRTWAEKKTAGASGAGTPSAADAPVALDDYLKAQGF